MQKLVLKVKDDQYALFLQFLKTLSYVEVVENKPISTQLYDFSDLVGKLQWNGDAVSEQRQLRDEW